MIKSGLKGVDELIANLNKKLEESKNRGMAGLIECAGEIHRETETSPPLTPVDLGNLRASFFYTTKNSDSASPAFTGKIAGKMSIEHNALVSSMKALVNAQEEPAVVFGFSANYGIPVHEMRRSPTGKPINWKRPGSGPEFFQRAIEKATPKLLKIMAREIKK